MIPKECKRLAEVGFPVAEVTRQSAREKSIRHGHPSTLHLWRVAPLFGMCAISECRAAAGSSVRNGQSRWLLNGARG